MFRSDMKNSVCLCREFICEMYSLARVLKMISLKYAKHPEVV